MCLCLDEKKGKVKVSHCATPSFDLNLIRNFFSFILLRGLNILNLRKIRGKGEEGGSEMSMTF